MISPSVNNRFIQAFFRSAVLSMGLLGLVCNAGSTFAAGEAVSADYAAMSMSTVTIKTINYVETDFLGDSVWEASLGSGVLVSSRPCEVWTNYHVVSKAAVIQVFPNPKVGEVGYPASLYNADPRTDLAILRMENCPGVVPVRFGNSDLLQQGDTVFAASNPTGLNPASISRGIISHTHRLPTGILKFVQTDAAVCRGSSGGGLFNRSGELIAMISAIVVDEDNYSAGFAYAIPVNTMRKLMARLHEAPPKHIHIGLEGKLATLGADEATELGVPDKRSAVIVIRNPDRPPSADQLEIRDVIYEVNGTPIPDLSTFKQVVSQLQPGDAPLLSIVRSGIRIARRVPVVSTPVERHQPGAEPYDGYLGMQVIDWEGEARNRGSIRVPVIKRIANLGPAHYAGIRSNQHYLIRHEVAMLVLMEVYSISGVIVDKSYRPVTTSEQLGRIAKAAAAEGKSLVLEVQEWLRSPEDGQPGPFTYRTSSYHLIEPRAFASNR